MVYHKIRNHKNQKQAFVSGDDAESEGKPIFPKNLTGYRAFPRVRL